MFNQNINYSIHTYELFTEVSLDDFWLIYKTLQSHNPSIEKRENDYTIYNSFETAEYTIRKLPFYGINEVRLMRTDSYYGALKCLLYIIVNPYNAYMRQLYSDGNIVQACHITEAVKIIYEQLALFLPAKALNSLKPSRMDFCVNLHFQEQTQADEYIKLLRRGIPPKCLREHTEPDSVQKRNCPYPDSFLLECASYSFEVYSKYRQMNSHYMLHNAEDAAGVVRIELRAGRRKLNAITKKCQKTIPYDIDLVSEDYACSFNYISAISKNCIHGILRKTVGTGNFYSLAYVRERIENSPFPNKTKQQMTVICSSLSRVHKTPDLLKHCNVSRKIWADMLDQFNLIGCSPITVPRSFQYHHYPGIESWDSYF